MDHYIFPDYDKNKQYMDELMVFIYAKEILKTCYQINKSRCLGCQYLVANQLYHECFTNTLHEIFEFYFEEALNEIEHEKIVELWKSYVSKFHIPNKSCVHSIDTYNRDWWKEKSDISIQYEYKIKQTTQILSILDLM